MTQEPTEIIPTTRENTLKLPLWKNVLEHLIHNSNHGDSYTMEDFEQRLKCGRAGVEFGISISHIRQGLEHYGMHLSQKGAQFLILMPEDNARILELFQIRALRNLKRAVILGSNTPLAGLTDSQKREHEKQLSKAAFRLAFMRKKTHEIATKPPTIENP